MREETYLLGPNRVRLCLACQAVKNIFTSGSRSYSGPISSLARRNLPRTYILICRNWHKRPCQQQEGLLLFFVDSFLTDRANELTRSLPRKGCLARVLLFLVS